METTFNNIKITFYPPLEVYGPKYCEPSLITFLGKKTLEIF